MSALAIPTGVQAWDTAVVLLEQAVASGSPAQKEAAYQHVQDVYNNLAASSQTTPEVEAQLVAVQDEVTALYASGAWQQAGTPGPGVVTTGATGGLTIGTLTLPWIGVALVAGLAWLVLGRGRGGSRGWQ